MTDRPCPGHDCARPLNPDETLCRRCTHRAERIIGDLPAEAIELDITISRQTRTATNGRRRLRDDEIEQDWRGTEHAQPARPLPWNEHAATNGDDALALLYEWADYIAQWHGEKGLPVRTSRPAAGRAPLATQAAGILLRHIDWIRTAQQGPDLAHAMWITRQRVRALTDRPLERVWAGPCHALLPATVTHTDGTITVSPTKTRCQLDLYRAWGSDTLTCDGHNDPGGQPGCGAVHTLDDRRKKWLLAALDEHHVPLRTAWETLPLLLAADITAPEWDTVRKWTQYQDKTDERGKTYRVPPRLRPVAVTSRGVKLYRGGDILQLVADQQPRRGRRRRVRHGKVTA